MGYELVTTIVSGALLVFAMVVTWKYDKKKR